MTLPDPGGVKDSAVQRALDDIRKRFPISAKDVADDVATQAEIDAIIAGGVTFGNPVSIEPDDSMSAGVAASSARSDHQHAIVTESATTITNANAEGTASSFARSDHNHALGTGSVGATQITGNEAAIIALLAVPTLAGANTFTNTNTFSAASALNLSNAAAAIVFGGDTNLFRSAADMLTTNDSFKAVNGAATLAAMLYLGDPTYGVFLSYVPSLTTNYILRSANSADTSVPFRIRGDGLIEWGGGASFDTNLYRAAANTLKTDDGLTVAGIFYCELAAGAEDVATERGGWIDPRGSNTIFNSWHPASGVSTETSFATRDWNAGSTPWWQVRADGLMQWGPGSGSALDVGLWRPAAGQLQTDGKLYVVGLVAGGKVEAVTDATENSDAPNYGQMQAGDTAAKARANHTGTQLASTISDFDTQVRTNRLDQMAAPTANVSLNSKKITNLADPVNNLDATNKQYVDFAAQAAQAGLSIKNPVRCASTANISGTFGALSATGSGSLTVDGVALDIGDRVLLKNQTTASQNGIWEYSDTATDFGGSDDFGGIGIFGDTSSGWTLTRTTDADSDEDVDSGMFIPILEGTAHGSTAWILTTADPITIGTTSLTFAAFLQDPELIIYGVVNTTTPTIVEGTGYSVSKNGTGDVTITFDTAFDDVPSVTCSAMAATGSTEIFHAQPRNHDEVTTTTVRIVRHSLAYGGGASDGHIHFQAIGPR